MDEEQAPYIRKTYEMYATGLYSLKQIADHISELGYRSRLKDLPMIPQQVHKILTNITYAGWVKVDDETGYVPSIFPVLVDQETFNTVQKILHGYSPTAVPRIRSNPDFPLRHIIKVLELNNSSETYCFLSSLVIFFIHDKQRDSG